MLLATVASLIVLVVVVVAIATEDADERAARADRDQAAAPDEHHGPGVPHAVSSPGPARPDFPRARDGYDPAAVDAYLDHLETLVGRRVTTAEHLPAADAEALRTEAALALLLQRRDRPDVRQDGRAAPYPAA